MIFTVTEDVLMFPQTVFPGREDDKETSDKDENSEECRRILFLMNKGEDWGI